MDSKHTEIEKKWQKYWEDNQTFKTDINSSKPKHYVLDMFPYPSGSGLHIGHLEGYTATDIFSRMKRMQGFEVLHPIGWDAFGLPAEQYAIKTNNSPNEFTNKNIDNFRRQIKEVGFSYDFSREINTTDPSFYKTTQWIFSELFKKGLAEYKNIEVNWCPELGTVLANEEVLIKNGKMVSERGEFPVVKKLMSQWVLKITKYADKLLEGLEELEWPESVKKLQTNWIGKSEGIEYNFETLDNKHKIKVFTTMPETIFGVTFITLAPEHPMVIELTSKEQKTKVENYIEDTKKKTIIQRKQDQTPNGIFLGSYAKHPITNEKIEIWIGDYVLNNYATGSVMACPGGDKRDFEFAKKYGIKIIDIFNKEKKLTNSDFLNEKKILDARREINKYIPKNKIGSKTINYKLNDWLFSRQRYWGEPFPLIHLEDGEIILDPNLPLVLPNLKDFSPTKDGKPPLSKKEEWINVDIKGVKGKRETNTMPQWAGSCWYYMAYILKVDEGYLDIDSKEAKTLLNKWLPVDLYIGGQEHAVLHLMYARFWHLFLRDIGIIDSKEPFKKLFNQGMVLGSDGTKMSKSIGNVVNPDEIIKEYGADSVRITEMFLGSLEDDKNWTSKAIESSKKWIDRVERLFDEVAILEKNDNRLDYDFNLFIKNVSTNMEKLKFNLAISDMMVFINKCYQTKEVYKSYLLDFLKIFSTFAPHLGEELWFKLGNQKTITFEKWPTFETKKMLKNNFTLIVQVNGKLRGKIEIEDSMSKEEIFKIVKQMDNIKKYLTDGEIKKEIYVPKKIINFIVG